MSKLNPIAKSDITASLNSGARSASEHVKFSTDKVQLAFGKHQTGRIVHVGNVENGRGCDCHCPACSEQLVAKQGKKMAWHFAHASGGSCRDALSASFAAFMAQLINDGEAIILPEYSYAWGLSRQVRGTRAPVKLASAEVRKNAGQGPFEVIGTIGAGDQIRQMRILFRCVKNPAFPAPSQLKADGISTLQIDLLTPLGDLYAAGINASLDEDWARAQLLEAAPRKWLWNAASQNARDTLIRDNLEPCIDAMSRLKVLDEPAAPMGSVDIVERFGFGRLLETSTIRGEKLLGPSPKGWRAALVQQLLIDPLIGTLDRREMMLSEIGFGRREIARIMGKTRMVRDQAILRQMPEDDLFELARIAPDIRKPIDIIDDYLKQIWAMDIIRAKPTRENTKSGIGIVDQRLHGHDMPFWLPSDDTIAHVHKLLRRRDIREAATG
jgi:hypothetical protein